MNKVFMDGGSGINIVFANTLRKMNMSLDNLKQSENTFHGIVPGKAVYPLGSLWLEVVLGDEDHFRKESVEFGVVD